MLLARKQEALLPINNGAFCCLQLKLLREQLLKIINVEQNINSHKAALSQMQRSYQPTLEKTDFAAVIGQHAAALETRWVCCLALAPLTGCRWQHH